MLTKKKSEADDTRVSDLYVAEPLYILERDLHILRTKEKEHFRKDLDKIVKEYLCQNKVNFAFNIKKDSGDRLFFKKKPLNKQAVFDKDNFVGALRFNDVDEIYVSTFCSNKYGRIILNKYVFPLVAIDDYTTFIKLSAVKSAIGFYWTMGFDFFNPDKNAADHDKGNRFEQLIKQYGKNLVPYLQRLYEIDGIKDYELREETMKKEIPENIRKEFTGENPVMIWKRRPEEVIRVIPKI